MTARIFKHEHWSGKHCPAHMRQPAARWRAFGERVAGYLSPAGQITEERIREIIRSELKRWESTPHPELGPSPLRLWQALTQRMWAINRATDPARVPGDE